MKLRNKRTGEIIIPTDYTFATYDDGIRYRHHIYYSLAELNEEWEDYKPAEPLIKDEKTRKAVKAWAEANEINPQDGIRFNSLRHGLTWINTTIEFNKSKALSDLEKVEYTIAELCGEEEECES